MTKHIKFTHAPARKIRDTARPAERVDPEMVARALGAELVAKLPADGSPFAIRGLRYALHANLKSRGGRPGLEGAELRPKIPMSAEDWHRLESLAEEMASDGFTPTPAQVGSRLLHDALAQLDERVVATRASESPGSYSTAPRKPRTPRK